MASRPTPLGRRQEATSYVLRSPIGWQNFPFWIMVGAMRFLLAFVLALVLPFSAQAQETGAPSGDELLSMIGVHRYSPQVQTALHWVNPASTGEQKGSVIGKGLKVEFTSYRLSGLTFTVRADEGDLWKGTLPLGVLAGDSPKKLGLGGDWVHRSDELCNAEVGRALGDVRVVGTLVEAHFKNSELVEVKVSVDLGKYTRLYSAGIRNMLPISEFKEDFWPKILGQSIAGDDGSVLAAWVGVAPGENTGTFGGLTVNLVDGRWVESVSFATAFAGNRPFGLGYVPKTADVAKQFGRQDGTAALAPRWVLSFPNQAPLHLKLSIPGGFFKGDTILKLSRKRKDIITWRDLMLLRTAPEGEFLQDLARVWKAALEKDEAILGRWAMVKGMLGEYKKGHSRILLGGVIGGTVYDPPESTLLAKRELKYKVRYLQGFSVEKATEQLMLFKAPISAMLGEKFEVTTTQASDKDLGSLTWTEVDEDMFTPGPSLTIEIKSLNPKNPQVGFNLDVVVTIPK